jgi:hypothetical protein
MPQALPMPQAQPQNAAHKHTIKKKKMAPPATVQGAVVQAAGVQTFSQTSSQQQGYAPQASMAPLQGQRHMYQFPYIPSGYEQHGQFSS